LSVIWIWIKSILVLNLIDGQGPRINRAPTLLAIADEVIE
jgi:hypothetical protein